MNGRLLAVFSVLVALDTIAGGVGATTGSTVPSPRLDLPSRDFTRVTIDQEIFSSSYLYGPKQAVILPLDDDPYFFFAFNDDNAHVTTIVFRESQMLHQESWINQDVASHPSLRYVSPSAYWNGVTWYPQVTYNGYQPSATVYLYDQGGIGSGTWTAPFDVTGPVYDCYLPLTETGPGNVVYMDSQARQIAEGSHIFKAFDGFDGTTLDPPGQVMIFPDTVVWGHNYENSQLLYHPDTQRLVILAAGYQSDQFADPENPLLVAFRESSDGGLTWGEIQWADQSLVPDMPGSIPGINGHYHLSFFDGLIDALGRLHVMAVVADSGYYENTSFIHGMYDLHEDEAGWTATPISDGTYGLFNPRELLGGDSWLHSPSLAMAPDGTIIAAWNDVAAVDWADTSLYQGIWVTYSHDHGATWAPDIPVLVAAEAGLNEYHSHLVPTATLTEAADSGFAYILTIRTRWVGADGPLDMIRAPYPRSVRAPLVSITGEGETVTLTWDPVPGASSYRVHSSDVAWEGYTLDGSGVFIGESWSAPFEGEGRYFYVTSVGSDQESSPSTPVGRIDLPAELP